jgi:asparagine synthase (glutamine-hydrolysing)
MCGICGIAGRLGAGVIERMVNSLQHRGPDDRGVHIDRAAEVAIGHTRLSIVELTNAGHQPMQAANGQVWNTFNGEIYNHLEIRAELAGHHRFRGGSDTETILCAYLTWGKECLHRFNGMFAFAIWDGRTRELWLVRDRLGIKPLYYSVQNGELRFASEVRTILADPEWPREPDLDAVDAFLRLRYVPHPHTLINGISSLSPGSTLTWTRGKATLTSYWQPRWEVQKRSMPAEAEERFLSLLNESVRLNLMSDVRLGVFLSGGLDSTLVTAIAREEHNGSLQTFSVAFEGDDEDARIAAETAQTLNCQHTTVSCCAADLDCLPDVAAAIDMPVGDAVILPTFYLNKAARKDVKAVMTGEGADEILMGYAHQAQLLRLARVPVQSLPLYRFGRRSIPGPCRALAFALHRIPDGADPR